MKSIWTGYALRKEDNKLKIILRIGICSVAKEEKDRKQVEETSHRCNLQRGKMWAKLARNRIYHLLCYSNRAHCPLLQCWRTKNAILAGALPYFVVSSFKCEGKNNCNELIPELISWMNKRVFPPPVWYLYTEG